MNFSQSLRAVESRVESPKVFPKADNCSTTEGNACLQNWDMSAEKGHNRSESQTVLSYWIRLLNDSIQSFSIRSYRSDSALTALCFGSTVRLSSGSLVWRSFAAKRSLRNTFPLIIRSNSYWFESGNAIQLVLVGEKSDLLSHNAVVLFDQIPYGFRRLANIFHSIDRNEINRDYNAKVGLRSLTLGLQLAAVLPEYRCRSQCFGSDGSAERSGRAENWCQRLGWPELRSSAISFCGLPWPDNKP